MDKLIYYGQKVVGEVKDRTFITKRTKETIYRKYNSVNISEAVLSKVRAEGADRIRIDLELDGQTHSKVIYLDELGRRKHVKNGTDWQMVIPIKEILEPPKQKKLF